MDYEVIISQNTAINGNISINGCTRIDGVIDGTWRWIAICLLASPAIFAPLCMLKTLLFPAR